MSSRHILTYANLDFEDELASQGRYQRSSAMHEVMGRWRYLLRLVPGAEEAVCLGPDGYSAELPEVRDVPRGTRAELPGAGDGYRQLILWGVTPTSLRLIRELGLEDSFPTLETVRRVNDKRFSHALEQEFGIALPYARLVNSLCELSSAVEECPHDWVLKHPLGVSGRERTLGKAGAISQSALGWARRRLAQGWGLVFEPWVEDKIEFSLHFEIERSGSTRFLGHTVLRSDASGTYRGNAVMPGHPLESRVFKAGEKFAERVAREGYFGPMGIDGMRGRLGEVEILRPLTEINARMSFGRMALYLGSLIPLGWSYRWWHPRATSDFNDRLSLPVLGGEGFGEHSRPAIYRLPEWLDPEGVGRSLVLLAENFAELERLEAQLD